MSQGLAPDALLNARRLFEETGDMRYAILGFGVSMCSSYGPPEWIMRAFADYTIAVGSVPRHNRKALHSTLLSDVQAHAEEAKSSSQVPTDGSAETFDQEYATVMDLMLRENMSYAAASRAVRVNANWRRTMDRRTQADREYAQNHEHNSDAMPTGIERYICSRLRRSQGQ